MNELHVNIEQMNKEQGTDEGMPAS